jgi:hypothetical protein
MPRIGSEVSYQTCVKGALTAALARLLRQTIDKDR